MTLVKWTPKRNMINIFDEVEQMMQQAFGHSLANKESDTSYSPLLNVSETDNEYLVTLDLPGVEKKDVNVSMNNNILTISGERRTSDKGEEDIPIWHETIAPSIQSGKKVLIVAHGNSLRALVKHLDNISDEEIVGLNIPTGVPLVYELNDQLNPMKHYYLGDQETIAKKIAAVSAQGKAK